MLKVELVNNFCSIYRLKGRRSQNRNVDVTTTSPTKNFSNSDSGFQTSASTLSQFQTIPRNVFDETDSDELSDSLDFRLRRLNEKLDSVSEKASGMLRRSRDLVII